VTIEDWSIMLTNAAIKKADDHANAEWKEAALDIVRVLSFSTERFTTDDVWEYLESAGRTTHEPRAMGAIMRKAVKEGYIRSTGEFVKSRRPECHCRPVAVWEAV